MTTEQRFYETVYRHNRPGGRSVAGVRCPFCDVVMEARVWSLAGSGKRCDCGALLSGVPESVRALATRVSR